MCQVGARFHVCVDAFNGVLWAGLAAMALILASNALCRPSQSTYEGSVKLRVPKRGWTPPSTKVLPRREPRRWTVSAS